LKQTDTIALRIHHVKAIAGVNPHVRWVAEVRAFDHRWIKRVEPLPFMTEDLNLVKFWIADVNVALAVYC